MKQLYWIDDNIQQMLYIIQGAITKFWKLDNEDVEGIASKVIIFGNACEVADKDEIPTEEDEKNAYVKLFDLFLEGCMKKDGPNVERPMYTAKKVLIQNPVHFLYKREVAEDLEAYKKMKCPWISGNLANSESADYMKATQEADLLIERMNIEPNSVVGIDIALFYGDLDRLREKKRILSMELCHKISEKKNRCFIYSSEADDDELRRNWEEVYKELYSAAPIKIYQRSDFMQKGKADIVKEVEEMFK